MKAVEVKLLRSTRAARGHHRGPSRSGLPTDTGLRAKPVRRIAAVGRRRAREIGAAKPANAGAGSASSEATAGPRSALSDEARGGSAHA